MERAFAVRAVIIDEHSNIPILKVGGGEYYKIPGGTLEEGEGQKEAFAREIKEEAGCKAEAIGEIGNFEFYVKEKDKAYHSTCYLAKLTRIVGQPQFDDWEKERGFELVWLNINEAIKVFKECHPTDPYEKIIHRRDLDFIQKAKEILGKRININNN